MLDGLAMDITGLIAKYDRAVARNHAGSLMK
jgi:hypothetical protein